MATLKSAMSSFENEKKTLASKLESNNDEGNKKDLLNFQMQQKIDNIKNQTDREINELKRQNLELDKELQDMKDKIYKKTDECLKVNDDMLEIKNNLSRELALSNQKVK